MQKSNLLTVNSKISRNLVLLLTTYYLLLTTSGCGAKFQFNQAKKLEQQGYYIQAIEKYKKISEKFSKHQLAPEVLYRAGKIYQTKLKIYSEGINLFGEVIRRYPENSRFVNLAKNAIFNSPDYFPLYDGNKWIEGDSSTAGKNMRVEWSCQIVSTDVYKLTKSVYAGGKFVTEIVRYYREQDFRFEESSKQDFSTNITLLLKYPFETQYSWLTDRDDRKLRITILTTNAAVKVVAGEFKNCLKVRYEDLSLTGSYKYEYYAPDVGLVLTTVGKKDIEHRNTELLSYKLKEPE